MRRSPRTALLCAALGLSPVLATLTGSSLMMPMFTSTAVAYPKPSVYPVSWQLKFEHSAAKRIVVTTPGTGAPVAYWYMTYTVTNTTDQEQSFLPVFEMVTNDGKVIRSDKDVPGEVFTAIKKREHKGSLEPMEKISGRLLIGEDQARDGVAIWPEPSRRMGTFDLFVTGLSGESVFMRDGEEYDVKDWTKLSDEDRKKLSTLRKTLQLTYQVPGDETKPELNPVVPKGEEWLMR